jgi:hypothetical protein
MHFGGGAPATTTPPPVEAIADGTYVVGITLFFFASLVANVGGFFGPWSKWGSDFYVTEVCGPFLEK